LQKEYIYGAGGLLATIEPTAVNSNGTRYTTSDNLGTPRVVTNSSAGVVSRHDYLPFGEELVAGTGGRTMGQGYSASDGVRQHFTQKERDGETGLDFFASRYYSSSQGRFTSPDSFGGKLSNPQSLNLYAYVLNNPLKWNDPTGHQNQDPDKKKEAEKYGYTFNADDALVYQSGNPVIFEAVTVNIEQDDRLPFPGTISFQWWVRSGAWRGISIPVTTSVHCYILV
jgi:RHS repeat-associated protein